MCTIEWAFSWDKMFNKHFYASIRVTCLGSNSAPWNRKSYIQIKCGADSVYPTEGCGKTLVKDKRYNTPHSNRYGVSRHIKHLSTYIYTRMSVVRSALLTKKTSTFSIKDLRKTLSQYVLSNENSVRHHKYMKSFLKRTTLTGVLQRWTKKVKPQLG
mgnify:CR=1 FL=1